MTVWWLIPISGILTLVLTGVVLRYARSLGTIDIPNARSSHTIAMPRGGGIAIAAVVLSSLPILAWAGALPWATMWGMFGAGLCMAVTGFVDDRGHVAARWRLAAQLLAAFWVLWWIGVPALSVFGWEIGAHWALYVPFTLYLIWLVNLYNFIDGIDGIASIGAAFAGLGGALLYTLSGVADQAIVPLIVAAAAVGFLSWNFPPARIFMGDTGSGFLGIVLGALSLQAAQTAPQLFWSWLILLAVFIVDATWTLLRRLVNREAVYEAHCSHAYQHAASRFGRHLPVLIGIGAINLVWLLPLALWVGIGGLDGALGLGLASAPLLVLAIRYGAGRRDWTP